MSDLTRKAFLKLAAGSLVAATAQPNRVLARAAASPKVARKTLIEGASILSMDRALGEIQQGDILIDGGKIVDIGRHLSVGDAERISARGKILMPGMIDGHRHVWESLDAGGVLKTNNAEYVGYQTWKKRAIVSMTAADHYLSAYIGSLQAIDSGVTSVVAYEHAQYSEDRAVASARAMIDAGLGGWFVYQISHSPTYGPGDTISAATAEAQRIAIWDEEHFRIAEVLRKGLFSDSGASMRLGIALSNGSYGSPMPVVAEELRRARSLGVGLISQHNARAAKPSAKGTFGSRGSGIADLYDAKLIGPDLQLVHGYNMTDAEIVMLRDGGGMLCSTTMNELPSVAPGRARRAPAHGRAHNLGLPVSIGIDFAGLTQDYFEHVRMAFWSLSFEPEGMAIAADYKSVDTLNFATKLGAEAIRLGDVAGSIAKGKRADLVLLDTSRIGFPVTGSLADRVLNFACLADIDSVWVAGRALKRHGQMVGVDWVRLKAQMEAAQERVAARASSITFT